jgi:hypothetical protein
MDLLNLVWYGNIAGELLVLARFFQLSFVKRYKWFALYLAASFARDISLIAVNRIFSRPYFVLWTTTDMLVVALLTAAVFEAFFHAIKSFPDMGTFAKNTINICLAMGGIVAVTMSFIEAKGYIEFWFVLKRLISSILAVSLLGVGWVYLWVRVSKNTVWHVRIMTVFCSIIALSYFSLHLGLKSRAASILELTGSFICFVLWLVCISPTGEDLRVPVSKEESDEALRRLKELIRRFPSRFSQVTRLLSSYRPQRQAPISEP